MAEAYLISTIPPGTQSPAQLILAILKTALQPYVTLIFVKVMTFTQTCFIVLRIVAKLC